MPAPFTSFEMLEINIKKTPTPMNQKNIPSSNGVNVLPEHTASFSSFTSVILR